LGSSDGTVTGQSKIVDNGSDDDRWVVVIMGDGFRSGEQAAFRKAASDFVTAMKRSLPFAPQWKLVNIYRVDVESNDSGVDNPCGAFNLPNSTVNTYFDSSFCAGVPRAVTCNTALVLSTAKAQVPKYDDTLIILNSTEWAGGATSNVPVMATASTGSWIDGALHEGGHAWFGLADEYLTLAGCDSGEAGHDNYVGSEPGEPNVTKVKTRSGMKWRHLVKLSTKLPTTGNPDCSKCDPRTTSGVPQGTIGLFEGARYFHCGLYRPEFDCKMRTVDKPFCAVCRQSITRQLKRKVDATGANDCFIASAVYEGTDHPDVRFLRHWRDEHLVAGARWRLAMSAIVAIYCRIGPAVARFVRPRRRLADAIRRYLLERIVSVLRRFPWH
jgi:hypothetical protein